MTTAQQRINKKTEWINKLYKLAISETSQDFLEMVDFFNEDLIGEASYNDYADAYKKLYYKIKFMDNNVKQFHCFSDEYEELRFKLITIYKAVRNVLEKEFDISQICVNDNEDRWMFIS